MNGATIGDVKSFGYEECCGVGAFLCNGVAAPTVVRRQRGLPFTVTYGGTGLYTVTFETARFKLPQAAFYVDANLVGPISSVGDVRVVANNLHLSPCQIQIQYVDKAGAALAPPASGVGMYVSFSFFGSNSTGA